MKGIATITVRGADGKIKEKRTEHNTITTAHVEKLKQAIALQKFTRSVPNTGASMFQGIWAHSAPLANLCDMQPVVLCGSTSTRASGVSTDYAVASVSQIDGGDIESTWAWTLDKSVSISALSLHSNAFINGASGWGVPGYALSAVNDVQGLYCKENTSYQLKSVTFQQSVSGFNKTAVLGGGIIAFPLYTTNEFIRSYADSGPYAVGIVFVCDNTGTTIRQFPTAQFEGLNGTSTYYFKVMPTPAADWLFVINSTAVYVYKIPRTATSDTIPLVTTINGTGFGSSSTLIMLNCAIFNSTSQSKTMFVGQSDGTYTLQTGVQLINGVFRSSYFGMYLPITESNPTPTVSLVAASQLEGSGDKSEISLNYWGFPHNTILNLSSPITGESGDTITITYTVSVELDVAPTPPAPPTSTFSTDSWATIAAASADGTASTKYNIGDEKTVTLTTGEEIVLQIWGFDHDDLADGSGKAGITLGMKGLLNTAYRLRTSGTSDGGWNTCVMRTTTMPAILATLPSDLQAVIKTVTKQSVDGLATPSVVETDDQLFLFSPVEIAGASTSYSADGEQYAFWQTFENNGAYANDRIKFTSDGSAESWWTRYIYAGTASSTDYAYYFASSGESSNVSPTALYYVCFGCCV